MKYHPFRYSSIIIFGEKFQVIMFENSFWCIACPDITPLGRQLILTACSGCIRCDDPV
jgi:hypothetical protein